MFLRYCWLSAECTSRKEKQQRGFIDPCLGWIVPKTLLWNFNFPCPDQVVEETDSVGFGPPVVLHDHSAPERCAHGVRSRTAAPRYLSPCLLLKKPLARAIVRIPQPAERWGKLRDEVGQGNGWAPSCSMQRVVESCPWMWRWALPLALHRSSSRRKNDTPDSKKGTAVSLFYFHPPSVAAATTALLMAAYQNSEDIRHLFLMILLLCHAFSTALGSILEMVFGTWILLKDVMWGTACLLPWIQGSDFRRGWTAAQVSHAALSSRGTASLCLVSSQKFAWLCGCIWLIWLCRLGYSPRYAAEKPALWIRAFVKMDPICTWFHQLHEMYRTFIWWNRQSPCSKREKPFCLLFHRRLLPYEEVKPSVMLLCS